MKSYNAIFNEQHEPRDATELQPENLPEFDILAAGFPCQAFSVAGDRGGFEDTRGTLFFEIARIARRKLPKILLLENVKGLLNHSNGETFEQILSTLDELGYDAQWQVLNSKYHGVPQNRERVFIVAHRRGEPIPEVFPFREPNQRTSEESERSRIGFWNDHGELVKSKYSRAVDANYFKGIDNHGARTGIIEQDSMGQLDYIGALTDNTWLEEDSDKSRGHHEGNRVYGVAGISPTLATNKGGASGNSQVILDWHGHKDKPPALRNYVPTLRAESHGHQPKLLQKSHDWRENNELREFTEYSPTIRSRMGDNLPLWLQEASDERGKIRIHRDDEKKSEIQGYSFFLPSSDYVDLVDNHDKNLIEPVMTPDFKNKDQNKTDRVGSQDGTMFTVDSTSQHGLAYPTILDDGFMGEVRIYNDYTPSITAHATGGWEDVKCTDGVRIRKLTPRECWRLQGFPDWAFDAAEEENSDTQLYKQAGNSVTVNVIEDLGDRLAEYFEDT